MARSSLLRDLRLAFSLGTFLLSGLLALGMAYAMHHSLEVEDAAVLNSQGRAILVGLGKGGTPQASRRGVLESAHWRLVAPDGRILEAGDQPLPVDRFPSSLRPGEPGEVEVGGQLWSVMVLQVPEGSLQLAMDRSHEEALLARFHRLLLVGLLLAALGSALVGHLVARRGLRPLVRIAADTARIEARDLNRRLDGESFPEELAGLVEALNGALGRLHGVFVRLEHLAGDLAHELRTPLQNLRLELEGLVLRPPDPELQRERLGSVLEELDRLASMVEQMLFLARSSVPGTALHRESLPAGEVLRDAAAFFSAAAEEAGLSLEVEAPGDLKVHADAQLLHRALQNLLANAVRHTPRGGRILLQASPKAGGTTLQVLDDGEGIPEELLPRLGERFARAELSRERGRGGAGLGLAIVRGILELHGGTLQVESRPGKGTRIELDFPGPAQGF